MMLEMMKSLTRSTGAEERLAGTAFQGRGDIATQCRHHGDDADDMATTPQSNGKGGDVVGLTVAALVLSAFFLPVVLISVVGFVFGRGKVTRRESLLVAGVSAIALAVLSRLVLSGYGKWVMSFFSKGHGSPWDVPVVSILLLSLFFTAVALAISTTAIGNTALSKVMKPGKSSLSSDSILPGYDERSQIGTPITSPSSMVVRIPGHKGAKAGSQFLLGYGKNNQQIFISTDEMGTHAFILGTTGSGKTEALKNMIGGLAAVGWDVIMVDLKEDTKRDGLKDFMEQYAELHVLPYQGLALSNLSGNYWFDPIAGLGRDEMRDTILSLMEFDDQHWQALSKNLLGQTIALLFNVNQIDPIKYPTPSMRDIADLLQDGSTLAARTRPHRALLKSMLPSYNESDYSSLSNPTPMEVQTSSSFAAKIQGLYVTEAGQRILSRNASQIQLDVTKPGFTYVGLDSNGKADLTKIVSSGVLQRMNVYVSERNTGANRAHGEIKPKVLIIDEAGSVDRDIVISLLERARSANISVVLSTQSPSSWKTGRTDDWSRITNNTNVAIIMRQANPDEAEICADYIGKSEQYSVSQKVTEGELADGGSARLSYEHHVAPEQIRDLVTGEAILRSGTTRRVEYVKVMMRNPRD